MVQFRHMYFQKPETLKESYEGGKRHYVVPGGDKYPSVTTVLSIVSEEGIKNWKKGLAKRFGSEAAGNAYAQAVSDEALPNGTEFHSIIEDYLNNDPLYKYKKVTPKALFEQAKPEIDKINNIWAQEVQLWSSKLRMAGRVDCVAEFNGIPSIIDFKTANKKKKLEWLEGYFLQETAYAEMLRERTNHDINQIVTIISGKDGSLETHVRNKNDYIDRLHEVIEEYNKRNS